LSGGRSGFAGGWLAWTVWTVVRTISRTSSVVRPVWRARSLRLSDRLLSSGTPSALAISSGDVRYGHPGGDQGDVGLARRRRWRTALPAVQPLRRDERDPEADKG
jgi:hypothetical protein